MSPSLVRLSLNHAHSMTVVTPSWSSFLLPSSPNSASIYDVQLPPEHLVYYILLPWDTHAFHSEARITYVIYIAHHCTSKINHFLAVSQVPVNICYMSGCVDARS